MSAQPCGCDPDSVPRKWTCSIYPNCAYGRWEVQDAIRQELKLAGVDEHQPAPRVKDRPAIQDLVMTDLRRMSTSLDREPHIDDDAYARVIADVEARKEIGLQRYGTLLQAHNGRDALLDAYQEALDLCQYLRQVKEEGATWVDVTYGNALRMTLHLRDVIKDRDHAAVTSLGDPSRGDWPGQHPREPAGSHGRQGRMGHVQDPAGRRQPWSDDRHRRLPFELRSD